MGHREAGQESGLRLPVLEVRAVLSDFGIHLKVLAQMGANQQLKFCPRPPGIAGMTQEFQRGEVTIRADDKVEVKVGSGSVIVEQRELHNLIEALSELRSLVARDRALMNVGSA